MCVPAARRLCLLSIIVTPLNEAIDGLPATDYILCSHFGEIASMPATPVEETAAPALAAAIAAAPLPKAEARALPRGAMEGPIVPALLRLGGPTMLVLLVQTLVNVAEA